MCKMLGVAKVDEMYLRDSLIFLFRISGHYQDKEGNIKFASTNMV